jgi:hypothetical protein
MKQVPTKEQYQNMVRAMPTPELEGLIETFEYATAINSAEALIKSILNAEMERRILQWEAQ